MSTKKKHNLNNITTWIVIFIFLALAIANIFNYINLKNPTIQTTAVFIASTAIFIAEIFIIVVFMLTMLLDAMQQELYNIKNSLDDLYDIKQINDLRSTVNNRHVEKLLKDIEKNY